MKKRCVFSRAEMEANYPYFREFVYAAVREEFARSLGQLPDIELEELARQENALPSEAFISALEIPD